MNAGKINSALRKDIDEIHRAGEINRSTLEVFEKITRSVQGVAQSMGEMLSGLNEQATASAEIVRALSSIQELTGNLRDDSAAIQTEASRIDEQVEKLASSSQDVARNVREVTERVSSNAGSIRSVNEIASQNADSIRELSRTVARFRT